MSESRRHLAGIAALERFVHMRSGHRPDLVVYCDMPGTSSQRKPPFVGGFRPDLFARTWKDSAFVIGESKTTTDIHTAHSKNQIGAFIDAVREDERGVLVVSVPFAAAASARALLDVLTTIDDPVRERVLFISPEAILDPIGGGT